MARIHSLPRLTATAAIVLAIAAPSVARGQGTPDVSRPATLPAVDPTARLRALLPADVADRVLARIAEARSRGLAANALEQRALKFAARGIAPASIERAVAEHAGRQGQADAALHQARGRRAAADEIDAGAEAIRQGVSGDAVAALAKSAPSGRSLVVPLHVLGELAARGLPSDAALSRVQERLAARADDRELSALPEQAQAGQAKAGQARAGGGRPDGAGRPANPGRGVGEARGRPGAGGAGAPAGGPPAGVPGNGGAGARPKTPVKGGPPPGKGGGRPPEMARS